MRFAPLFKSFIFPSIIPAGQSAPNLSLTADDGAWARSVDYTGRSNLVLVFVHRLGDPESIEWVKKFDGEHQRFEQENSKVFVISTSSPKVLRSLREEHNLEIPLLFDPFAIDARRFGMSGRRLRCVNGVIAIDKNGTVLASWRQRTEPQEILEALNPSTQTKEETSKATEVSVINSEQAIEKLKKGHHLIDVRTHSEYDADHVPGVKHIPIDQLQSHLEKMVQKDRLIFICQAGGRSYSAAEFMTSIGSKEIFVVKGGMSAWTGPRVTGGKKQEG